MPIQNIKRVTQSPPEIDVGGDVYGAHYDDSPEPLILVAYAREGDGDAEHARGVAESHDAEHGQPAETVILLVDEQGNVSVVGDGD